MPYPRGRGKPPELASKTGHSLLINQKLKKSLKLFRPIPHNRQYVQTLLQDKIYSIDQDAPNPIEYVCSVDGGLFHSLSVVKKLQLATNFRVPRLAVIKIARVCLQLNQLTQIKQARTITPATLKECTRSNSFAFIAPVANVSYDGCSTLIDSFRHAIYDFFDDDTNHLLIDALRWLLYKEYSPEPLDVYPLGDCRHCKQAIILSRDSTSGRCQCGKPFFLTDALQLHLGIKPNGSVSTDTIDQLRNRLELIYLLGYIKWAQERQLLHKFLFVADGRLAIHSASRVTNDKTILLRVRDLIESLPELNLIGVEKSGSLVNFAQEITGRSDELDHLKNSQLLFLDNQVIEQYLSDLKVNARTIYGEATLFGTPMIYKEKSGNVYSLTVAPYLKQKTLRATDFSNLDAIGQTLNQLKYNRYHNALLPIVLANKEASISPAVGLKILIRFFREHSGEPIPLNLLN